MKASQNIEYLREQAVQLLFRLGQLLSLISDLERDHEKIKELEEKPEIPPEYEQRFLLEPLQAPDQVKGRGKTLGDLEKAHKNHEPLLVEGKAGCGMSSFLNAGLARFENAYIIPDEGRIQSKEQLIECLTQALGIEPVTSVQTFAAALPEEPKMVLIFENLERLFLRKIQGFELLETFLLLIQRTKDKIFWIVSGNQYPLDFLDHVLQVRDLFPNRLILRNFDREEPEKETEKTTKKVARQTNSTSYALPLFRVTKNKETEKEAERQSEYEYNKVFIEQTLESLNRGYQNKFFKPPSLSPKLERALSQAKEEEKQKLLRDDFFERLHQFSNGHISRALLFWIKSVVGVREGQVVWLKAFEPKNPVSIKRPQEWFALEAIFQHNSLSITELSEVIRHPRNECRFIVNKLLNEDWLHKRKPRDGQQQYQINLLYTVQLQDMLKNELTRKPT